MQMVGVISFLLLKIGSNIDFIHSFFFFFLKRILKEYFKTNLILHNVEMILSPGGSSKWNFNNLLIISVFAHFCPLPIQHLRLDENKTASSHSLASLALGGWPPSPWLRGVAT